MILTTTPGTASGRTGRPRRADVEAAVLTATVDLIRSQGYAGTTLDDVAAAAGVAKTTIYRRWHSKRELVVAALVDALGEPPVSKARGAAGLRAAIGWLAGRVGDPGVHQLLVGLLGEAGRDAELRADLRRSIRDPFQERAVRQWGADPDAIDLAFDVVVGTVLYHLTMAGSVSDEVLDQVTALAGSLAFGTGTVRS